MRSAILGVALLGMAACAPELPGPGAGFSPYANDYGGFGDAPVTGTLAPTSPTPPAGFDPARVGAAIDAAEQGAALGAPLTAMPTASVAPGTAYGTVIAGDDLFDPNRPRGDAPAGIAVQTGEVVISNSGISDEQDFDAVAARETIASDAERIARNRAQYLQIEPTALPERSGSNGPNIVEYAINTSNGLGEPLYNRSSIRLTSPEAACKRFRTADLAQEAFLRAGGPERDPRGLDPDGDGFACAWDPRPFRTALQ
jgi:hypothetical protein